MSSGQSSQSVLVQLSEEGGSIEQSFQVVNKRPSSQTGGRKGVAFRENVQSSAMRLHSHGYPGDEGAHLGAGPRKKTHTKDKEAKPRPLNQRYGNSKTGEGTSLSSRGKDASYAYLYTSRHRNVNNLTDSNGTGSSGGKSYGKTGPKITSANRFEKLDPDIDCEASGISTNEDDSCSSLLALRPSMSFFCSSSSLKSAEEKRGGGKERIAKGGKVSFRKGVSSRQQQQMQGSGVAQAGGLMKPSCASHSVEEMVLDEDFRGDGSRMRDDQFAELHKGGGEGIDFGRIGTGGMVFCNERGKVSQEGASTGETATSANTEQQIEEPKRIVYERKALLDLRKNVMKSQEEPSYLGLELSLEDQSTLMDDASTRPAEEGKPKLPTALALIKDHDKLLSKVSLSPQRQSFQRGCSWKEKNLANNGTSCGSSMKTGTPPTASPLKTPQSEQHFTFDDQKSHSYISTQRHSNSSTSTTATSTTTSTTTTSSTTNNSTPRVINHTPLRDREYLDSRHDGQHGWGDGRPENNRKKFPKNKHYTEPEPEWMEYGPTDRYDVIELKGFDEDDQENHKESRSALDEAIEGVNKEEDTLCHNSNRQDESKTLAEVSNAPPISNKQAESKTPPAEVSSAPPISNKRDESKPPAAEVSSALPPVLLNKDNEFILDGFDFSTGVSICQELDLDEEDGMMEARIENMPSLLLTHEDVKSPSQLSNVLLKALCVNGHDTSTSSSSVSNHSSSSLAQMRNKNTISTTGMMGSNCSVSVPANALTLEEVHARENIHPSQIQERVDSGSSGQGMAAFNKLIAAMQSKQQQQQNGNDLTPGTEEFPCFPPPASTERGFPTVLPTHMMHSPNLSSPHLHAPQVPSTLEKSNLAYHLDRDLLDLEVDLAPASEDLVETLLGKGEPNLRRLKQLQHMIDKLDFMDPMAASQTVMSSYLPPPPVHSHLRMHPPNTSPLQQGVEGNVRGPWIYPERQYCGSGPGGMRQPQMEWGVHPSPQQVAVPRQHQMLINGGGRSANNWAVEMERRRIMELRQMQLAKEKDMYSHGSLPHTYGNSGPPPHCSSSSKPNISLLPTAVVRQMHNSKVNHQEMELPKMASAMSKQNFQVRPTEASMHGHRLTGQHASGMGEYGGYHHHHNPSLTRMGPPPGTAAAYPHKVVTDPLPPMGMAYPHHYNMSVTHGLSVQSPYQY